MSKRKKEIRRSFRDAVFARDDYKCKMCGYTPQSSIEDELDAHHICDRNEIENGGYVKENGITLCRGCHKKAEVFHETNGSRWVDNYHPDDLYHKIGSSYQIAIQASRKFS